MSTPKERSRAWQLVTLAVVALPWVVRDELVTRLDARTHDAEEIRAALYRETERSVDAAERREDRDRLHHIEILAEKAAEQISDTQAELRKAALLVASIKHEADEVLTSVRTLDEHLDAVELPQQHFDGDVKTRQRVYKWLGIDANSQLRLTTAQMKGLSVKAHDAANQVLAAEGHVVPKQYDDLLVVLDALPIAYEDLDAAAELARDEGAVWANVARWVAWLFAALGALMIGKTSET